VTTQYRQECMQALELQMSWLRWWEGSYSRTARETLLKNRGFIARDRLPEAAKGVPDEILHKWQVQSEEKIYSRPLKFGEVVYVPDEFCDIIGHIVDQMPDDLEFSMDMLPARCGFVVFDRDMPLPDPPAMKEMLAQMPTHLQHAHFRAIGWHVTDDDYADGK
jgi:hypothetical protein